MVAETVRIKTPNLSSPKALWNDRSICEFKKSKNYNGYAQIVHILRLYVFETSK